jgi:hypothetical protein
MTRHKTWAAKILAIASATASATLVGGCGADIASADAATDSANEGASRRDGGPKETKDVAVQDVEAAALADINAPEIVSVRRPFLVGSSMRVASAAVRDDWSEELPPAKGLDEVVRGALARAWLDDGLQEHASIAAFARFAMLMLGVGAPSDLVIAAQRAAIDEVRHARACFSLARRYGAKETGPGALRVDDALGPMTLAELAALTAEEGCVGETLGVLLAEEQAAIARDPVVRPRLARIARDEAVHAELAWRFVAWAVASRGEQVLGAVEASITRALATTLAMEVLPLRVDALAWAAHGRLSCAEARAVATRGASEIVLPALRALRARPGLQRLSSGVAHA